MEEIMIIKVTQLFFLTIILLLFGSVINMCASGENIKFKQPRIVGGTESPDGEWPWMTAIIKDEDIVFCGASLINAKWLITAANSFEYDSSISDKKIVVGEQDLSNIQTLKKHEIKRIIIHPEYDKTTIDNDIALIELKHGVGPDYSPVQLYNKELTNQMGIALGWGSTNHFAPDASEYNPIYSDQLNQVKIPIVDSETCIESTSFLVTDNMFCAGYSHGGKDSCLGDSGGPFIIFEKGQWKIAGLVSWGEGCAWPGNYGFYTRVPNYISFIKEYVPMITIKADDVIGAKGANISVPIIAHDIDSPISFEAFAFELHYDTNDLTFESISITGTQLEKAIQLGGVADALEFSPGTTGIICFFPERFTISDGLLLYVNFEINFDASHKSDLVLENFILENPEAEMPSVISSPSRLTILSDITIKADNVTGANGDNISIPIIISDIVTPLSLEMMNFEFHYDTNVLTFDNISFAGTQLEKAFTMGGLADGLELTPGVIGILSFFPIERITINNGLLCYVNVSINSNARNDCDLVLENIQLENFEGNIPNVVSLPSLFSLKMLTQYIEILPSIMTAEVESNFSMSVQYSTNDDYPSQGLGLRIHYNSQIINYVRVLNVFEIGLLSDILIKNDIENFDKDSSTDKIIVAAWSSIFDPFLPPLPPLWMGPEPTKLFDIEYKAIKQESSSINITFSSISPPYTAQAQNASIIIMPDNTPPVISGLSSNVTPSKNMTWQWSANEECTYRFAINELPFWSGTGSFDNIQTATKIGGNGTWYIHVQAKDIAGNISDVTSISAILDNTPPEIINLDDVQTPVKIQTWNLQANEPDCKFRYSFDKEGTLLPSGAFKQITSVTLDGRYGNYFVNVQAQDLAGNISAVKSASVELEKPKIEFKKANSEGYENETSLNLEINLSHAIDKPVTVYFEPVTDSQSTNPASEDKDYELPSELIVSINAGETTGFIHVIIIDDSIDEFNEEISFVLKNPNEHAVLGRKIRHTYTIKEDDYASIKVETPDISMTENDPDGETCIIGLKTEPLYNVNIECKYDETLFYSINPEILTFTPSNWSEPKAIKIKTIDDDVYKGNICVVISFVANSKDDDYNNKQNKTEVCIDEDEFPPESPFLNGPTSPYNNSTPRWTWQSGGGSKKYRYSIGDHCNLEINSSQTEMHYYEPSSPLTDQSHTFCIQEYHEPTKSWSSSGISTIEIDTGLPCSNAERISSVTLQNETITISYRSDDIYKEEQCGSSNSGTGVALVELWASIPGNDNFVRVAVDSGDDIDNFFEYKLEKEGKYRFITRAKDYAGNNETHNEPGPQDICDTEFVYTKNFSGYAILAVGAVTDQEGIDPHTLTADNIYKHLINRHFGIEHDLTDPLDHIKYFNPHRNTHTGVDNFESDDSGQPISYKLSLENAIQQWAFNNISSLSGPLYIILINHGAQDTFYLSDNSEIVTPSELHKWIGNLESNLRKTNNIEINDIVIVVGTCYSGSFINELSGSGRIVITSSTEDEPSYRGPKEPGRVREGAFFVSNLFNELAQNKSLAESFITSVQRTEDLTSRDSMKNTAPFFDLAEQHPLLDDNGDKKGSNNILTEKDGNKAEKIYLGFTGPSGKPVRILEIEHVPQQYLTAYQNTVSFKATVSNYDQNNVMWIEIRKPGDHLPSTVDEFRQKVIDLEEVYMTYNGINQFDLDYQKFNDPGKYTIYFYVKDSENIISGFDETYVYKNKLNNNPPEPIQLISPINLDAPENQHSEETEFTNCIFQWKDVIDPDKDKITYTLSISKNTAFEASTTINKKQLIETITLVKLPDSWDASDIYWKVTAIDNYGAWSESSIWRFHTNNIESKDSVVFMNVYDHQNKRPIPRASVKLKPTFDQRIIFIEMNQQGHYIKRINPGAYEVEVSADHYNSTKQIIIINDLETSLSFALQSRIQTGDINRNGNYDLGDAIQCLQILSGLDSLSYYFDPSALTGDRLEVQDAIFIMQVLSEVIEYSEKGLSIF